MPRVASAAILLLIVSFLVMMGMVTVLVMLRKGEGPRYSASRLYDANRREAVRLLTGESVEAVPREQWYVRERAQALPDDPLAGPFRETAMAALKTVIPAEREAAFGGDGAVRLAADDAWVVPAVSTADLRAGGLDRWDGRLVIGLVLVNPEPPGGDARRVTIPVQVLFPALVNAGREELVKRFEELRKSVTPRQSMLNRR